MARGVNWNPCFKTDFREGYMYYVCMYSGIDAFAVNYRLYSSVRRF